MPNKTFQNLSEEKKKKIRDPFLREFAIHVFDDASISSVVKKVGISKGSIYQYFRDKQDLFVYLTDECVKVRKRYVGELKRDDYVDYWEYFRDLYKKGLKFDSENPLESHFLHNLVNNLNSPSIQKLYDKYLDQTIKAFEVMVENEIEKGNFRNDIPIKTIAFFLYKSSLAIGDQMVAYFGLDPKKSIANNISVYQGKGMALMKIVDEYVVLLKSALNKNN